MKKSDELLHQFCEFYNQKNMSSLLNLFTKNATLVGTVIDEIHIGFEEIKTQMERDFSQASAQMHIVKFLPSGEQALYSAAICKARIIKDGQLEDFDDLRTSITVEREGNDFKISHMHASFPDSSSPAGYSFPKKLLSKI